MNKTLKDKWVTALRSGDYKQGKGTLYCKSTDTYCCLGVLGHIMGHKKDDLDGSGFLRGMYARCQLYSDVPVDTETENKLAQLNDEDTPFPEIANYIEDRIPGE